MFNLILLFLLNNKTSIIITNIYIHISCKNDSITITKKKKKMLYIYIYVNKYDINVPLINK